MAMEESRMRANMLKNKELFDGDRVNVLIPVIDLINHYHPQVPDASDYISFSLQL